LIYGHTCNNRWRKEDWVKRAPEPKTDLKVIVRKLDQKEPPKHERPQLD